MQATERHLHGVVIDAEPAMRIRELTEQIRFSQPVTIKEVRAEFICINEQSKEQQRTASSPQKRSIQIVAGKKSREKEQRENENQHDENCEQGIAKASSEDLPSIALHYGFRGQKSGEQQRPKSPYPEGEGSIAQRIDRHRHQSQHEQ